MTPHCCKLWNAKWRGALAGIVFCLIVSAPVRAAESDLLPKYFDALRARGLFSVAEEYASASLAQLSAADPQRIVLSIELASTLVDHGILNGADDRIELWKTANRVLSEQLQASQSEAARLQLESWTVILEARKATALAFEAAAQPEQESARTHAIQQLNQALDGLNQVVSQVSLAAAIPSGQTQRNADGKLSAAARQLLQQLQIQSGKTLLWLVELMSPGTERTSRIVDAVQRLEKAQRDRSSLQQGLEIAVLQSRAARLQGDPERARRLLERVLDGDANQFELDHILAEQVRLALSLQEIDVALQKIVERMRTRIPLSAELRAVAVEAHLQAHDFALSKGEAAFARQLDEEARLHHQQTWGTWRYLSDALLDRHQQNLDLGVELARIVREAVAAWQAGQIDLALQKYQAAAQRASDEKKTDLAFEYALTRGAILLQKQRWSEAEAALGELLVKFSTHPRAVEADLLRCYAIGRNHPGSPEALASLKSHIAAYPNSSTVGEAWWMIAVETEQQQLWDEAVDAYLMVAPENSHHDEANLRAVLLVEKIWKTTGNPASPGIQWNRVERISKRVTVQLLAVPNGLNQIQCRTCLQCACLLLQQTDPAIEDADQLLRKVQRSVADIQHASAEQQQEMPLEWKAIDQSRMQLVIVSLARQQKYAEARQTLRELGKDDASVLLTTLAGLTELTVRLDVSQQQELGTIQRMTVQELTAKKNELNSDQQRLLQIADAQASIALQDWPDAIQVTESLLAIAPNNPQLIHQLINVSLKQGTPADLKRARELWQRLEQLEKKGSTNWIEARVNIAELLIKSNEIAAAKKVLGVTRTLYPNMGTPELKRRSETLWSSLNSIR